MAGFAWFLQFAVSAVALVNTAHARARGLQVRREKTQDNPVADVVTLLQTMQVQLQAEAEADQAIFDDVTAWCDTNVVSKETSIDDAEKHIDKLTGDIEVESATSAALAVEIAALEKQIAADTAAVTSLSELRQKQSDEYHGEDKDLLESITALKLAIDVLSKHHSSAVDGAFLQVPAAHLSGIAAMLQDQLRRHANLLKGTLKPSQRRAAQAFVQTLGGQPDYLGQTPTYKQAYTATSGEIFGILNQMLEEFEADKAEGTSADSQAGEEYNNMKVEKEAQIEAGEKAFVDKKGAHAESEQKHAQAKVDLELTKANLAADETFLMSVKEKCQMTDTEWTARQETREDEMKAITKALEVLTSEEASNTFDSTYAVVPSFLQKAASSHSARRAKAGQLLANAASQWKDAELASLAAKVKIDAFTEVMKDIDEMVEALLKEKDDEIKERDDCIEQFHQNDLDTYDSTRDKEVTNAHISTLSSSISTLDEEILQLNAEMAAEEEAVHNASESRGEQHTDFQATATHQKASQELLELAKAHLLSYYGKDASMPTSLMQRKVMAAPAPAVAPPPEGFDDYNNNENSFSVISLIEELITDTEQMQTEATRAEAEAQEAYEVFVEETTASVKAKRKSVVEKTAAKSAAEAQKHYKQVDLDDINARLHGLSLTTQDTHAGCDDLITHFDDRQAARDEEVEALRQAKDILSGAEFS